MLRHGLLRRTCFKSIHHKLIYFLFSSPYSYEHNGSPKHVNSTRISYYILYKLSSQDTHFAIYSPDLPCKYVALIRLFIYFDMWC